MTSLQPICEIRPRKDWHGFDLVGHRVPLGELRFERTGRNCRRGQLREVFSRSHPGIIRVFDESGAVVWTADSAGFGEQ
jgi:hypothetical protein